MKQKEFIITHPSQLNSLSPLPILHQRGIGKIVLDSTYTNQDKEQVENEINKNYYACACSHGAKGLLLGFLIFSIVSYNGSFNFDWNLTKSLVTFFVGSVSTAMLGKLVGLIQADMNLKVIKKEIQKKWKHNWAQNETIGCG